MVALFWFGENLGIEASWILLVTKALKSVHLKPANLSCGAWGWGPGLAAFLGWTPGENSWIVPWDRFGVETHASQLIVMMQA